MLILSDAEVRRALPIRAAIESQRKAFAALAAGGIDLPLRTPIPVPAQDAVALFMPARVGGDLGAKIVSVFPRNSSRGLPTVHGVVLLLDAETGRPTALMQASALTALRTAAASGLATELLAPPGARNAAIIGTGVQAETHLLAICAVRPIECVTIFSRAPDRVAAFIGRMQAEVAACLVPAASAQEAIRAAEVICTTTTSPTPVLDGTWLRAGVHINGIGSYTTEMQEVDTETVRRAGRVFVDSRQSALAEAGDVIIPLRQGVIRAADLIELGEVVSGRHPGRDAADAITFFKSVGLAIQDMTAAAEVLRRATEMNLGLSFQPDT